MDTDGDETSIYELKSMMIRMIKEFKDMQKKSMKSKRRHSSFSNELKEYTKNISMKSRKIQKTDK
jgi:hypothetical protein